MYAAATKKQMSESKGTREIALENLRHTQAMQQGIIYGLWKQP